MSSLLQNSAPKPPRTLWTVIALLLSSLIIVLGSLDAYQVEDDGVLGRTAHQLFPLINLTYEGMYISAMVIFSLAVFLCIQQLSFWLQSRSVSIVWLIGIALFTILAAFGGLLMRRPQVFLVIAGSFILTLALVTLLGSLWIKYAIRFIRFIRKERFAPVERNTTGLFRVTASLLIALMLNLLCAIGHFFTVQEQSPQLYAMTFSSLTGNRFSEYVLFSILGIVFVVISAIVFIGESRNL